MVRLSEPALFQNVDVQNSKFNHQVLDELNTKNRLSSIKLLNPNSRGDTYVLNFEAISDLPATIYQYYDTRLFHYVEPDYIGKAGGGVTPNDGEYGRQWGLENDGSFNLGGGATEGADIDIQKAWEITTGSEETIIAILDSGLKLNHPEFSGRIFQDGIENKGKDFANDDSNATDDQGHGTNVTGIAAASADNGIGYAGVNWKAQIMPLKILDSSNQGYYSWWTEAIYYAVDNGAKVLNMSVGGSSYSASMEDAINYATTNGAIVVACMMNTNDDNRYYPAAYENTIAVGSTDPDDTRSEVFPWSSTSGSNFGSHIDLSAPGNYIYGLSHQSSNNYNVYWSGTSQATPHVAGVVSLLLAIDPDLTLESVRSILTNTAEDQVGSNTEDTEGWDQYHGHGRLNAYNALSSLVSETSDIAKKASFRISPNPIAKGENLMVRFDDAKEKVITIFDSSGRLVLMNKFSQAEFIINSKNLESGTYIIKVDSISAPLSSKKFIVK